MSKFERPRGRERSDRSSREDSPRRDSRGGRSSDRGSSRYGRDSNSSYGRDRPEVQMTRVICSSCKSECEVPFKPTSNKPVYCRDCFAQKGKGSFGSSNTNSNSISNRDLDIINEKLNKIMEALKIE